jgi:hypothetical protein
LEIFASQGAPPVSTTPVTNLPPVPLVLLTQVATGVKDTRGKICRRCQRRLWQIATGINNTAGKFATGVNDTGGK